jgi:hypothetical protein
MLSPQLLAILQDYWWVAKPRLWLFPGRAPLLPITTRQLYRVVRDTAAGFRRLQWRTAVTPFPHANWPAFGPPFPQSTPSTRRRCAVSPRLLPPTPLARIPAARSLQAKLP